MLKYICIILSSFYLLSCASSKRVSRTVASTISSEVMSVSDIERSVRESSMEAEVLNVIINSLGDDGSGCYINNLQDRLSSTGDSDTLVNIFVLADQSQDHANLITTLYRISIESFNRKTQLYLPRSLSISSQQSDDIEIKVISDTQQVSQMLEGLSSERSVVDSINLEKSLCE